MKRFSILAFLMPLASCQEQASSVPEPVKEVAPPPAQLCQQAREGLGELRKEGVLMGKGEHVMDQQAWMEIGARRQDQLVQALALEESCDRQDGAAEREVVIRNEGGQVIVRRLVSMGANLGTLFDE